MIWLQNQPYLELLQKDGKEPSEKEWKKEKERKEKFMKSLRETKKKEYDDEEDFSWDDIYQRYEFTALPADEVAPVVISFQPKKKKVDEHNRAHKMLNRLAGRFWADENHNLVKIEAHLIEKLKYGLGLLAKIEELQIIFTQQQHHQAWLPSSLLIRGRGQFALLKNENREVRMRYYDYYEKPSK